MASVDWYEAGRSIGQELSERGGSAANVEIGTIGFAAAKLWLDGVLDGVREKGLLPTSIGVSSGLLELFRQTAGWGDGNTYRGTIVMQVEGDATIVVAA